MVAWRYRGGADEGTDNGITPDFGYRKPNVRVNVDGIDSSRYVQVYKCDDSSATESSDGGDATDCIDPVLLYKLATVFDSATSKWKIALDLDNGTYMFRAVSKSGDVLTNKSDIVAVDKSVNTDTSPLVVTLNLGNPAV
jgi:hypothetical protein